MGAVLGAALSVGAPACRDEGPTLVNFEPPDVGLGAREVRRLAESGVEMAKPFGGWHFATPAELASWDPNGALGLATDAGDCWGWVRVGVAGDGDPRRYSQSLLSAARGPDTRTDVDEYVLYVGRTCHRWEIEDHSKHGEDQTLGIRATTIVDGKRRYTVSASARGGDYRRRRHCLDSITSAFDLRMPEP